MSDALREILIPIYDALELEFRPDTAGGVADFVAGLTPDHVIRALLETIESEGYTPFPATFDRSLEKAAEALTPLHSGQRKAGAGAALRPAAHPHATKTLVQPSSDED